MSRPELSYYAGICKTYGMKVSDDISCYISVKGQDIREIEIGNIGESISLTEEELERIYNGIIRCQDWNKE